MRSWARRGLVIGIVAGVLAGFGPGAATPAWAHVTVDSDDAVPGSTARVVFRMPNESDTNPSNRLEVHLLPEGAPPIASALTTPVPGWTAEVTYEALDEPVLGAHGEEITEAVSVISWTADDEDAAIQPGEIGEFPAEIGPLPEAEQLYFPALQSYVDVEEPVRWIGRPDPDGSEPPDPAPVLRLAAAAGDAADGAPDDAADGGPTGEAAESGSSEGDGGSSAGVWLGLAGLVAGLAGLALGGVAFARTRN